MRFAIALLLAAAPATAATLEQAPNPFDRGIERLPDLNLVRGARLKATKLLVGAAADEAWTLTPGAPWLTVTPAAGTGPATVTLAFDADALNEVDDAAANLTLSAPSGNAVLEVTVDVWPKKTDVSSRLDLIDFVKDRAHWPDDPSFAGDWQWWGFLPDDETHPGVDGVGDDMAAWEKTPCAPGDEGADCVREGQAGLASGMSADQAWLLSAGDPRVLIATLDSGSRWDRRDLINKFFLNADELRACPPPGVDGSVANARAAFDVNGDGLFNVRDYDEAAWVDDVNLNGLRDPQDLIYGDDGDGPCSDDVDDDDNGYVDDISGWDFHWNDNDASDDSDFGHGDGEMMDSAAEGHNGEDRIGSCPRCMVMPVRVGDSFVVDVNQFADGTIFAVESGANIVQEALGSLNATPYMQQAIDWAYANGVPIVASAADEASYHHNYPGNAEHTLYVHAIVADTDGDWEDAATFQNFGNCTNFGGHLMLSTPGTGCSSEATGNTSGHVGLVQSYFLQLQDQGDAYYEEPLTAEEVYQVLRASADDIDVPGAETDDAAYAQKKYPSNEGWDLHFGYGRNNMRRSLELLRDKMIPPHADLSSPRWFETIDPNRRRSVVVKGTASSPRLTNIRWSLQVAEGVVGKSFVEIASGDGAVEDGELGTLDLSASGPLKALVARAADPVNGDPEQYTATLLLLVKGENPDGDDVQGVFRKTIHVRADENVRPGFPIFVGASGESSPKLTDLDGDGREEIVVATADGLIHAFGPDGAELPGFPAAVGVYAALDEDLCEEEPRKCHRAARPFRDGVIPPDEVRESIVASLAVGDLDGDGAPGRDVVVATMDGRIWAIGADGAPRDGFPVGADPAHVAEFVRSLTCEKNGAIAVGCRTDQRYAETGFFSSPALVDLDMDGDLEIVVGGLDQWAYAFHHDGDAVNGWPVHLRNDAVPTYDTDGSILRRDDRIVSSPAIAWFDGKDEPPYVLLGTNEMVENSNGVFLYAIRAQGEAHSNGPFPDGWPTTVSGFIPGEILPFVGRGNPNSPAAADFDGDGRDEVVNAGMGGVMTILDRDGDVFRTMESTSDYYGEGHDVYREDYDGDVVVEPGSLPVINNPSIANLDGAFRDGRPILNIINGTAGLGLIQVANSGGERAKFHHSVSAWNADNGYFMPGFPHAVHDYQFFMNYSVADLDNDQAWEVLSGSGGYFVYAPDVNGREAPGFPKFTGQWVIGTPAVGDLDGDQMIDVVVNTRDGWLWAWETTGHVRGKADQKVPAIQWEGFHHDDHNTGNYGGPLKEYAAAAAPDDAAPCECRATDAGDSAVWPTWLALAGTAGMLVRRRRR